MKYIDAERLKAKLDEHYRKYQSKYMETRNPYTQGLIDALDLAEQVIDSLQQEQPEVELDKLVNEEFASHSRTTEYGLEATYNRAELYQLIKRMALVFNASKED